MDFHLAPLLCVLRRQRPLILALREGSVEVIVNNDDDDNDDNGDDDDNDDNGDDDDAVEGFCSGCRARFSTERLLLHWISPHLAHHLLSLSPLYNFFICSLYLSLSVLHILS